MMLVVELIVSIMLCIDVVSLHLSVQSLQPIYSHRPKLQHIWWPA